jgi:carboxymethylenebutenolidase
VTGHIEDVCRRLAEAGYVALAPELFHRDGADLVGDYSDFAKIRPLFIKLTNDGIAMDVDATLAAARARDDVDPARVGIVGFCVGGFSAFLAACRTDVAAAVCFYPGGLVNARPGLALTPPLAEADRIRRPVLIFFGDNDQSIPPSDVDSVRARLGELGVKHELHVYAGAQHGFFCDQRPSYHPDAAAQAWTRMTSWLPENLQ